MKKETYLKKLETTVITDDNTVGEAKAAKRVKAELKRFWKQRALEYVRQNEPDASKYFDALWVKVDVDFDLKAAGTVKVMIYNMDSIPLPYPPYRQELKRYTVRKRDLFS